jgi:hypothetical protein
MPLLCFTPLILHIINAEARKLAKESPFSLVPGFKGNLLLSVFLYLYTKLFFFSSKKCIYFKKNSITLIFRALQKIISMLKFIFSFIPQISQTKNL